MPAGEEISASEEEVYDRQLRLWGRNAQSRLKSSTVLIFGLSAINVEVAKNILLAGANITLVDDRVVTEEVRAWNFLIPKDFSAYKTIAEASAVSLREMNPLATVTVSDEKSIDIRKFSTVSIDIGFDFTKAKTLAESARAAGVATFLSFGVGGVGWWTADLVKHRVLERSLGTKTAVEITTASFDELLTAPLSELLSGVKLRKAPFECAMILVLLRVRNRVGKWPASEDTLKDEIKRVLEGVSNDAITKFLEPILAIPRLVEQLSAGTIPPCAAVVGGLLGEEVVKVVTRRDEPLVNTVTYTCRTNGAYVEKMPAKGINDVAVVEEDKNTSASPLVATVLEEDSEEIEEPMELD